VGQFYTTKVYKPFILLHFRDCKSVQFLIINVFNFGNNVAKFKLSNLLQPSISNVVIADGFNSLPNCKVDSVKFAKSFNLSSVKLGHPVTFKLYTTPGYGNRILANLGKLEQSIERI
jgi:hypothetical protein